MSGLTDYSGCLIDFLINLDSEEEVTIGLPAASAP
jgi:hypothetical protein